MSDDESTQQIDIDALRARARESVSDEEDPLLSSSNGAPGRPGNVHEDRTVMAPSPRSPRRRKETTPSRMQSDSISVEIDMGLPEDDYLDGDEHADDIEDVSDAEDVSLVTHDTDRRRVAASRLAYRDEPAAYGEAPEHFEEGVRGRMPAMDAYERHDDEPEDEARSLIGTLPGHDVAQALRAMMGDVPDTPLDSLEGLPPEEDSLPPMWEPRRTSSFEDNETMTRLPAGAPVDLGRQNLRDDHRDEHDERDELMALGRTSEDDALPAFALDDEPEPEPERERWRPPPSLDGPMSITHTSTSASKALSAFPNRESTAITRAVPSRADEEVDRLLEQTRATDRGVVAFPDPEELPSTTASVPAVSSASLRESLQRESMRDTMNNEDGMAPSLRAFRSEPPPASMTHSGMARPPQIEPEPDDDPLADDGDLPRFSMASLSDIPAENPEVSLDPATNYLPRRPATAPPPTVAGVEPRTAPSPESTRDLPRPPMDSVEMRGSLPDTEFSPGFYAGEVYDERSEEERTGQGRIDVIEEEERTGRGRIDEVEAMADSMMDVIDPSERRPGSLIIDDGDLIELVPEEIVEELGATDQNPALPGETKPPPPPDKSTYRPPEQRTSPPPAIAMEEVDNEEQELIDEGKFSLLVALYRQRLGATDGPNKKAAIILKIARVYENDVQDLNEAFNTLVDAFEIVPDNVEVVTEIDRLGKLTQRIGELADRVKKRMVPGAPDDKRVAYLAHVVYWFERVLGRGSEVSSLVSDIERVDKVHPLVLTRSAQLAAMNGDVKSQREILARAMERTIRVPEKVRLELALASAWAGTAEAMKHYETALTLDPTSIIALQGVKRLGKEKELYPQVKWALERQAEVAPTEAEKIDAMLELAELEETKFLKRELAAQLLELVLTMEPSHPQALKGLERCYHALRDWPALARVLAMRAEHAFEKKAKVELFELAAEVHESKLGDPAGAVEVYTNLLIVEPKHRRALTDLARLYEKMGDWDNVALYKARVAELAPTKRASSQELVKLGDYLNTPDRDPLAAKLQYERAVQVDPTNAIAWEAIQKIAQEAGDDARVLECLEARKKHTDIPRQRAAVLVELARVQLSQGDDEGAKKSYEAAIRADSSNEAAAVAMLDAYTSDERWAEAAPLCELLVNAAIRDRDNESLFIRLRLQTRIAAALGDAERALTASMAALDAQPQDPGAQADLLAVAIQCSGTPSLARAKEHLGRIATSLDDLTNDQVVKIAALHRELKDLDLAARCYEAARRREPNNEASTKELSEIYLEQADFPRACKLKVDLARNAAGGEARFTLLCEAGEIWARRADEHEKAASVFEEAREIKPQDPWLLQTLRWLYTELGEWELVHGVLEDMIQTEENAAKKLELILALAEHAKEKLEDPVRATDAFDRALDIDRKRLDLFEGLVRSLTEAKDWDRLERSYRKMIARVKDDDEPQLQFLLFHQLGLIYRDRLGDASRAFDALDAASRLEPENTEVRKIVIELLIVTDNLDNAVSRIRDEIDRDPHTPDLYAELYELFLRQHFFDKAWSCVNVLARLQTPSTDQRRFHEDYAPMPLDRVPGQIVEQAWQSHVFHRDLDPALTNILAILTPAVARMRFGQLRPEQRVGRPFTPTHSRMHNAVRETFDNASEILALQAPELLVADLNSIHPFTPALAPFGAVSVCGPAIEAQAVSLVYLCGKRLAEQRPELAARAFFPAEKELATLLASSMRVARNEGAKEATGSALDAALSAALSPQEGAQLRAAMMSALADNTAFDVKRWLQAADLSSMRAGLLICGDIEPARQAIGCEVAASSDLSPRDKLGELLKFAVSDLYSDLRGAIGVAVQA